MSNTFASRLRMIRGARGMTQDQLARASGICGQTLSAYEFAAREPTLRRLAALATALDVSIDQLAGREPFTITVD